MSKIPLWFIASGLMVALIVAGLWLLTSLVINYSPAKQHLTPAEFDHTAAQTPLPVEKVRFRSADGVGLVAWFVPALRDLPSDRLAVILTHGGGDDKRYYLPLAKILREEAFDVLLLDLRGHGESERSPKGMTLGVTEGRDVAAAAAFLADRKGLSRIAAVGVSMGGVATAIGAAATSHIEAIVLESSSHRPQPVFEQLLAALGAPSGSFRSCGAHILTTVGLWRMGASIWDIRHGLLPPWRLAPRLAGRPSLFVLGDKDSLVNEARVRTFAKHLGRNSRVVTFSGVGHGVYSEQPEAYAVVLLKFLKEWRDAHACVEAPEPSR